MRFWSLVLLLWLALACLAPAQSRNSPARPSFPAHRPAGGLPDISGMYTFLHQGEFVQVTIEPGNIVSGFVSRYGDSESDKGTVLDQFFESASYDGQNLTFATEIVHGASFQFSGKVSRGSVSSLTKQGYWVLKGMLTRMQKEADGKTNSKSRETEFKSYPRTSSKTSAITFRGVILSERSERRIYVFDS